MAGVDAYRTGWRNYVRGLWNGAIDKEQFTADARSLINRRLMQAWLEGAAKCGITQDDMTEDEFLIIGQIVKDEVDYLPDFTKAIVENSKKNGGALEPLLIRADMWVNRYNDVVNRAQVTSCGDKKFMWQLGPTEEHCEDCAKYNGRVYRGSTWNKYGILPKSRDLACHGFNCRCELVPTNKPVTKGKPPAMSGGKSFPGHAGRPGQVGGSRPRSSVGIVSSGAVHSDMETMVARAMSSIPPWAQVSLKEVNIIADPGATVNIEGNEFEAAAHFSHADGKVEIFDGANKEGYWDAETLKYSVAHEVGHATAMEVMTDNNKQTQAIMKEWGSAWHSGEDGFTDYSKEAGIPHETWAEMARVYFNQGRSRLLSQAKSEGVVNLAEAFLKGMDYLETKHTK